MQIHKSRLVTNTRINNHHLNGGNEFTATRFMTFGLIANDDQIMNKAPTKAKITCLNGNRVFDEYLSTFLQKAQRLINSLI